MIYLIIVLTTLFLCSRGNPIYDNITGIASLPNYRYIVIMFLIFCSYYYAYKMIKVYQRIPLRNIKVYNFIIFLTAIIMSIGSFFPYTTNGYDICSKIHVYSSMLGCVSFLTLLFIYTRYLSVYNLKLYLKIHWFYDVGLQFLFILFIVFTRVNGYIEILYSIIVGTYLYLIEKNWKKL